MSGEFLVELGLGIVILVCSWVLLHESSDQFLGLLFCFLLWAIGSVNGSFKRTQIMELTVQIHNSYISTTDYHGLTHDQS